MQNSIPTGRYDPLRRDIPLKEWVDKTVALYQYTPRSGPEKVDLAIDWTRMKLKKWLVQMKIKEISLEKRAARNHSGNMPSSGPVTMPMGNMNFQSYINYFDEEKFLYLAMYNEDIDEERPEEKHLRLAADFRFALGREEGRENWNMRHRIVNPAYREQQIGKHMLHLAENFFQQRINESKTDSRLTVDAVIVQLPMLLWLLREGYRGKTVEDLMRIDRILQGDRDLRILDDPNYARTPEGLNRFTSCIFEWRSALYAHLTQNWDDGYLQDNAYTISLKKDFWRGHPLPHSTDYSYEDPTSSQRP